MYHLVTSYILRLSQICPCNAFSFHSDFLFIFILRLNSSSFSPGVSISLLATIINRSRHRLMYLSSPNLARFIQSSTSINPRPSFFLGKYYMQMLSLGCNALCIVNIFLVILSMVRNSSLVYSMKGAVYLNDDTAHMLIACTIFPPFNFDCKTFLILRLYSLHNFSFISFLLYLIGFKNT